MAVSVEEVIEGLEDGNFGSMMKSTLSRVLMEEIGREEMMDLDNMIYAEEYSELREELEYRELMDVDIELYSHDEESSI